MKRIIRAAVAGSLVFALIVGGAIVIGQSNPAQPELFRYLRTCDGLSCYLGVVPGGTAWDDTVAIFEDQAGAEFDPMTNIAYNPPGFNGNALIFNSPGAPVGEIELLMRAPSISVGSLIVQYGSPCGVVTASNRLTINFHGMSVVMDDDQLGEDQQLQPISPVDAVLLLDDAQLCNPPPPNLLRWRGFKRYAN